MRARRRAFLLPLMVAALAACAPGPAGDEAPGAPAGTDAPVPSAPTIAAPDLLDVESLDACTILTREEAQALIGTTLIEPLQVASRDVSMCTYPGDPDGPTAQVEIFVGPGVQKQLEIDRDSLGHDFEQPGGIGDEAWQEAGMIFARSGTTWASIRLVTLDDPAVFAEGLRSAMALVLSRLRG